MSHDRRNLEKRHSQFESQIKHFTMLSAWSCRIILKWDWCLNLLGDWVRDWGGRSNNPFFLVFMWQAGIYNSYPSQRQEMERADSCTWFQIIRWLFVITEILITYSNLFNPSQIRGFTCQRLPVHTFRYSGCNCRVHRSRNLYLRKTKKSKKASESWIHEAITLCL